MYPLRILAVGRAVIVCFCFLFLESNGLSATVESSSSDDSSPIVLGMSTALSGPAAELGANMLAGVQAAFDEANRKGGFHGRPLKLIALDDGYEPARTAPNMRALIEREHVLAVIGNVGTPTAITAIPIANATQTPFFGAYTGAGVLRKTPPDRYIINYRASYAEETSAMVDALIEHAGIDPEEIAFFTQRDGYGDAGYVGGIAALKRHGLNNEQYVAHGRYERNTLVVEEGLANIMLHATPPKAVIMVGAYAPCARFIQLAETVGYEGIFLNVSFVGSSSLAKELGPEGDGVIVTQVVPHPDSNLQIAAEYRAALQESNPQADTTFGSFEGYVVGRIFCLALEKTAKPLNKEAITQALESMGEFNIGFADSLKLTPNMHQASHVIWPTVLNNGTVTPYKWNQLKNVPEGK